MNVMEKTAKVDVIAQTLHTAHMKPVTVLMDGKEQVVMKVSQIIFSIPITYLNIYLLLIKMIFFLRVIFSFVRFLHFHDVKQACLAIIVKRHMIRQTRWMLL